MPVVKSLMDSLVDRYGPVKGKQVYYAMEAEGKGPFAPGGKYRHLHEKFASKNGIVPSHATKAKKKPPSRGGGKGAKARSRGRR